MGTPAETRVKAAGATASKGTPTAEGSAEKQQEERRRVEVLKQKRQREEDRSRREWLRKRMRSDLTMDDILGQNSVRNHQ